MVTLSETDGDATFDNRRAEGLVAVAVLIGVAMSGLLVLSTSRALFDASASSSDSSVGVGSVSLAVDDQGVAAFEATNLAPGDAISRCFDVTYEGTIDDPGAVVVYSGGFTDPTDLASVMELTVEEGSGGDFSSCGSFVASGAPVYAGTLAGFDTDHSDYSTGVGTWDPGSTPESTVYRFTLTLPSDAPNDVQGDTLTDLVLIWEVQV
jgi:hypothetical protein